MSLRKRTSDLVRKLREAAFAQDPVAQAAIELLKLSADEVKESLVSSEGDDMLRQQGAARHLSKLVRDLTTEPPSIQEPK